MNHDDHIMSTSSTRLASRLASYAFSPSRDATQSSTAGPSRPIQQVEVILDKRRRERGPEAEDECEDSEIKSEPDSDEEWTPVGSNGKPRSSSELSAPFKTPTKRLRLRSDRGDRSPPQLVEVKAETGSTATTISPTKRTAGTPAKDRSTPKKAPKVPRPYAGPEVYAHLHQVPDHIKPGLKILFCGINPGKKSSIDGHHFAHPSNKFWKALYLSGITDRRVAPSEDASMPELFNFGLTNLCDRPTSEMSELSTLEMKLSVPLLTRKIMAFTPLVVCMVGKKIWDVYQAQVSPTAGPPGSLKPPQSPVPERIRSERIIQNPYAKDHSPNGDILTTSYIDSATSGASDPPDHTLTLYRLPSSVPKAETTPSPAKTLRKGERKAPAHKEPFDWHAPRPFRLPHENKEAYTYFWVTPNTSGLERTPLADVVGMFRSLNSFAQSLERGEEPLGSYRDIDIIGVKSTAQKVRRDAMEKGHDVDHILTS
ncbi:hypothetical protein BD324DRAFT_618904 [Kockovaella imperatae]|uniref:Uracil-DNA glycosylase-like domain-containing protein n=1 Tax=Kockovaella imperatae TaxID=4999 RepID=A0A1Y1UME1_9TREE|nr:hypothetical protein BD324DRAFT_618904 [Kockovaella imperatae]ORX39228.1 hypothetical protein BD324DRAFT_618904 [Kockovaella imperatae]